MEETAVAAAPRRGRPPNARIPLPPAESGIMDIRAAAHYLLISPDTLYKYATTGFVPAFKLGNRWRFRKSALDDWMTRLEASESAEHGHD